MTDGDQISGFTIHNSGNIGTAAAKIGHAQVNQPVSAPTTTINSTSDAFTRLREVRTFLEHQAREGTLEDETYLKATEKLEGAQEALETQDADWQSRFQACVEGAKTCLSGLAAAPALLQPLVDWAAAGLA